VRRDESEGPGSSFISITSPFISDRLSTGGNDCSEGGVTVSMTGKVDGAILEGKDAVVEGKDDEGKG